MPAASSEHNGAHRPNPAALPLAPPPGTPPGTPATPAAEAATPASGQPKAPPTPATTPANSDLSADKNTASFLAALPLTAPPMVAMFGRYQILEEFPGGGMGVVYRAHDTVLGREVALKKIRTSRLANADISERFYREAQLVAKLHHPHIIKIFDFGEIQGQHFFTMTLVRQASLDRHLERLRDDTSAAVRLLHKVAGAVQYIHDHGLLHRDLKPANILLEDDDEPLISDFGLAKDPQSDPGLTATGMAPGTPSYMAPEQAGGNNDAVCKQTDVWALGVILYEMLTGKRPFTGGADVVKQAILDSEPPQPRAVNRRLNRDLETIILKCLEKNPARRYVSAGALADDLGCWLRGEPIRAKPATRLRKCLRFLRRHPRWLTAVALLALTAALVPLALEYADSEPVLNRSIYPRLRRGQPVTLIGATGGPVRSKWIVPGMEIPGGGNFTIDTTHLSMLELLPDPGLDRYRFRVEVRHEIPNVRNKDIDNRVGIYFAHGKRRIVRGDVDAGTALAFTEPAKLNGKSIPGSVRVFQFLYDRAGFSDGFLMQDLPDVVPRGRVDFPWLKRLWAQSEEGHPTKGWRELAVEVTSREVRMYWGPEFELLGTFSMADSFRNYKKLLFNGQEDNGRQLSVRGGLGLYIYQSAASFRNAMIEPLSD